MRLNAPMRDQIKRKAIAAKFDPIDAKHKKDGIVLGHAFYQHLFGKHRAAIEAVPKAFVHQPSAAEITAGFVECQFSLNNGYAISLNVPVTDPLPARTSWHGQKLGLIKDEALCNRLLAWQKLGEEATKARAEAVAVLKALLDSVGTYATLSKEWPEGKKFYSSLPGDFPGNMGLPVVQINALNTMLGLPPHTSNVGPD